MKNPLSLYLFTIATGLQELGYTLEVILPFAVAEQNLIYLFLFSLQKASELGFSLLTLNSDSVYLTNIHELLLAFVDG